MSVPERMAMNSAAAFQNFSSWSAGQRSPGLCKSMNSTSALCSKSLHAVSENGSFHRRRFFVDKLQRPAVSSPCFFPLLQWCITGWWALPLLTRAMFRRLILRHNCCYDKAITLNLLSNLYVISVAKYSKIYLRCPYQNRFQSTPLFNGGQRA